MNVIVFGEDKFTATVIDSLIDNGHNVLLIVTPDYSNEKYKTLEESAHKHSIKLLKDVNVNSETVKQNLLQLKPELIISAHLRKILSKEIFSLAPKGAINIHPSLLPKYRGLSPQHQAILHGDTESGVTVHFIDENVDTGGIIIQKIFPVLKQDTILNVHIKMLAVYKNIVVDAIRLLKEDSFKPIQQKLDNVSYFGPLKKKDRQIDLTKTKVETYNLIRAVSMPYNGAYFNNFTVWTSEIPAQTKDLETKYPDIGFYFDEASDKIVIKLKDGYVVSEDFEINEL